MSEIQVVQSSIRIYCILHLVLTRKFCLHQFQRNGQGNKRCRLAVLLVRSICVLRFRWNLHQTLSFFPGSMSQYQPIIKPKCIIPYFLTESNNIRELNKDTYFTVCNFVSCLHSIKCRIDTRQPNISPRLSSDNYFHDIVCLFLFVVDLYGELIQQRKKMIRTILPQS
jgi:hypothetical protein